MIDYESLVGDDAHERERQVYQLGQLFDIRPEHSSGAHVLPGLPFGFEYLAQVTLREVNFGLRDVASRKRCIADEERPEEGFRVCQDCGVVLAPHQDQPRRAAAETHAQLFVKSQRTPA